MSNKEFRPTLSQLRTFVTVAENRHFGTAANKLGISQPSLSQALAALEHGLGQQLIERSTRKVIVTTAGQKLLPFAKSALDAADLFVTESHGSSGTLVGPLKIGIIPTVAPYILPDVLTAVARDYPLLEPHIIEEQTTHLLDKLRDGHIDVALVALPADSAGLTEHELYTEKMAVVVNDSHQLAWTTPLDLDVLQDMNLLLLDDGHCLRDHVMDLCRRVDREPRSSSSWVTRAASLTTIVQLVVAGMGSTLVPESALDTECRKNGLAIAQFSDPSAAQRTIGLVYRSSSSRIKDFNVLGELITSAFHRAVERAADLTAARQAS